MRKLPLNSIRSTYLFYKVIQFTILYKKAKLQRQIVVPFPVSYITYINNLSTTFIFTQTELFYVNWTQHSKALHLLLLLILSYISLLLLPYTSDKNNNTKQKHTELTFYLTVRERHRTINILWQRIFRDLSLGCTTIITKILARVLNLWVYTQFSHQFLLLSTESCLTGDFAHTHTHRYLCRKWITEMNERQ